MSIKILNKEKYVEIDTDQDLFKGKTRKEQIKIASKIIKERFVGKEFKVGNTKAIVKARTRKEYVHPSKLLNNSIYDDKLKASTELDNLLKISKYKYTKSDDGRHAFAQVGWEYYETKFKVGNNFYKGIINVANNGIIKTIYDITNITII